jgi:hypothetical protein
MADNKVLISDALRAIKIMELYPKIAKDTADRLQKYFRDRGIELTVVNKDIDECGKNLADCEKQVAAAEKTLAALVKAKVDPDTAKKLDAAIKTAGAALKALSTNLTLYDKFADKAEKDDTTIEKIVGELLKAGVPVVRSLNAANITLPVQTHSVQEAFDKEWPTRVIEKTFDQVGTELSTAKDTIAKGEIFNKSIDTLLSRRKDAFEPGTIAACGKVDTLKAAVAAQIAKLQPTYATAMKDMENFDRRLQILQQETPKVGGHGGVAGPS